MGRTREKPQLFLARRCKAFLGATINDRINKKKQMKTIQIGGGIILIVFSLFIIFGIIVSSLKEGDEDIFKYLTIPVLMMAIGIYLIVRGKSLKSNSD